MTDKVGFNPERRLSSKRLGPYKILSVLGSGGMGTVFLAEDDRCGRRVALKVLTHGEDPVVRERFHRECLVLSRLSHPNLVRVFESRNDDSVDYFAMEYIDGRSIESIVRDDGPLPATEAARIARDLADALVTVHEAGLIHRDIKPSNVLLDRKKRVVLTDFGLARVGWLGSLTATNVFVGTYQYASPEVLSGLSPRPQSDIYQLGLLLYIMLTGDLLPLGRTLGDIAAKLLSGRLPPPGASRHGLCSSLEETVMRAVARDPEDRFRNAGEFRNALDVAIAEQSGTVSVRTPHRSVSPGFPGQATGVSSARTSSGGRDASASGYASTTTRRVPAGIAHALLCLSFLCLLVSAIYKYRPSRPARVQLDVALVWIESEWDALSYILNGSTGKAALERAKARMAWSDALLGQVNTLLPGLLRKRVIDEKRLFPFLLRAVPSFRLQRRCGENGIHYVTPALRTLEICLTEVSTRIARSGEPEAVAVELQRGLLSAPSRQNKLDRLLELAGLPSSDRLIETVMERIGDRANRVGRTGRASGAGHSQGSEAAPPDSDTGLVVNGPLLKTIFAPFENSAGTRPGK